MGTVFTWGEGLELPEARLRKGLPAGTGPTGRPSVEYQGSFRWSIPSLLTAQIFMRLAISQTPATWRPGASPAGMANRGRPWVLESMGSPFAWRFSATIFTWEVISARQAA